MTSDIDALRNTLVEKETNISALKKEVEEAKNAVPVKDDTELNNLKGETDSLKSEVDTLKSEVDSLKSELDPLKGALVEKEAAIGDLKSEVETLKSQIQEQEGIAETKDVELKRMDQMIEELRSGNTDSGASPEELKNLEAKLTTLDEKYKENVELLAKATGKEDFKEFRKTIHLDDVQAKYEQQIELLKSKIGNQ